MPIAEECSPEQEVILGAVRTDRAQDGRIRELLRRGLDWQVLRRTALHHGVLPLLSVRLQEIGQDLMPHEEMARLTELYAANARRNLMMTAELLKALRLFHTAGIDVIPFKGPVVAVQAYGDISLRQFADLDLLVRKKDAHRVWALLIEHGYQLCHEFTPAQERSHFKRANEFNFASRNGSCHIDIHWRFAADYLRADFAPADVFARQTLLRLEGHQVPALAVDDMFLFLCLHGSFHLWTRLCNSCDIAGYMEANRDLDWSALLQKAEASGLRRAFLLGVLLARDLLAVEVPASVAEAADGDRIVTTLRMNVKTRLFGRGGDEPGFMETARFQLLVKDSFRDRLRYCFIRAFFPTVEDWSLISLPDNFYFIYFIIRLLRLSGMPRLKKSMKWSPSDRSRGIPGRGID